VVSEERERRLAELRELAEKQGGLYAVDALEYLNLQGILGVTKAKLMRIANKGSIRTWRPTGSMWWMVDLKSLDDFYVDTAKRLDE
jgi:hypothetical protein